MSRAFVKDSDGLGLDGLPASAVMRAQQQTLVQARAPMGGARPANLRIDGNVALMP